MKSRATGRRLTMRANADARAAAIARAIASGVPVKAIAIDHGISYERARQLWKRGQRVSA